MKRISQILFIYFILTTSVYGIKSINIVEVGEKEDGLYGSFNLAFNSAKGNSERERYSISTSFQKFNLNNIWLFNASYTFQQSKYGEGTYHKTANKSYLHIRNVKQISKVNNWEYFGQIEHNEFQKLAFRGLFGIGMRFKPFNEYKVYFGISPMVARETYLHMETESDTTIRINIYLNLRYDITEKTDISYVTYYQPKIEEIENFDLIQSLELENKITENFSFLINISYDYDSDPISSISKYDFEQTTAFKYRF